MSISNGASARGAAILAAAFVHSIAAAQAPAPVPVVKEGITVKVSQHVYVIPDQKASMVPNVGIIVGTRATLVVDPGLGPASGQAVLREVAKVSRNTELYIVNTHFHSEHTTGEAAFPADTKIIRAAAQQQELEELGMQHVARFSKMSPAAADVLKDIASFRKPAEIFDREKTLDLGGVRVRLMMLGPGHTKGDTAIFVEGDRVLFSGDLAMKNVFPVFSTAQSSRSWLASLDELDKLRATTLVPAHSDIGDPSTIEAYRGYLKAVRARVGELKREGKSSDEAAELLRAEFAKKYPDWAQPLRVHTAVTAVYRELP